MLSVTVGLSGVGPPPTFRIIQIFASRRYAGALPSPRVRMRAPKTFSSRSLNVGNSFMNFRVADIQACYELWKSRGAEFITEPIPKYGEIRYYIRDPDGYIIEVGQSTDLTYG